MSEWSIAPLYFLGIFSPLNSLALLMVHLKNISDPYDVSAIPQNPKTLAGKICPPPIPSVKWKPIYYL